MFYFIHNILNFLIKKNYVINWKNIEYLSYHESILYNENQIK